MHLQPLDPGLRRRNLVLVLCLTAVIAALVILGIMYISPEHAGSSESLLSGMK